MASAASGAGWWAGDHVFRQLKATLEAALLCLPLDELRIALRVHFLFVQTHHMKCVCIYIKLNPLLQ